VSSADVIARHRDAGLRFEAAGVTSFVLDHGDGEPVLWRLVVSAGFREGGSERGHRCVVVANESECAVRRSSVGEPTRSGDARFLS